MVDTNQSKHRRFIKFRDVPGAGFFYPCPKSSERPHWCVPGVASEAGDLQHSSRVATGIPAPWGDFGDLVAGWKIAHQRICGILPQHGDRISPIFYSYAAALVRQADDTVLAAKTRTANQHIAV